MLLRHRPPGIESHPVQPGKGLEHLDHQWIAVLRWLNANKVDYVVVGAVAHAIRGDLNAKGPVAIVPAPYGRNFERLSRALVSAHVKQRVSASTSGSGADSVPVKMSAEKLARGTRWRLRCEVHNLDIEASASRGNAGGGRAPGYQDLLYEAGRFELGAGVSVEVASLEDLEHFDHLRRTGTPPEIRISRTTQAERETA